MSTATAAKDPKANSAAPPAPGTLPPEEKFWQRYSAHGEAPISMAGAFAAHALGVGGLLLFSIYLASLFFDPTRSVPVEPVRLEAAGGGGGKTGGQGDVKGAARGPEDVDDKDRNPPNSELDDLPKRPLLDPTEMKKVEETFDPDTARYIRESKHDNAKDFARMNKALLDKVRVRDDNPPAKGKGGTGDGGGSGTGSGTGDGPGVGDGKNRAKLTIREKRMLRWHMRFTAQKGDDYLAQLRALGAILAFEVSESPPTFKVVRELRPGGPLLDEDVRGLNRIFWWDREPRSVVDILNALGARIDPLPRRFVAFMPESLEKQLFQMERNYIERVMRAKYNEDQIDETNFRVVLTPGGYKPELINVTLLGQR